MIKKETIIGIAAILFVFFGISQYAKAQVIYVTTTESWADFSVYVTDTEAWADLVVFKESSESWSTGNQGRWFFTETESWADKSIYITDTESWADLVIYYTTSEAWAGWKNNSKKQLLE